VSPRERAMVPKAEFSSYYGRPVLNPPVWEEREIAGYLFLGGLAGASSLLAAGAAATSRPALSRSLKLASASAALGSTYALVKDLGRPMKAYNMLRVFKPTSPMSVGSWILGGFIPLSLAAAASEFTGLMRRSGRAATYGAGLLGPAVATYTAVLVADTAVPAWHEGWRELPPLFAGSALMAAGGAGLLGAPRLESGPALVLAVAGAGVETVASRRLENSPGLAAEAYEAPPTRRMMRASRVLTAVGVAGGLASRRLEGRSARLLAAVSGLSLMAASATTRFGIFRAGMASAQDPRFTVAPQRQRADAANGLAVAVAS
jgi:hypothetical protein